MASWHLLTTVSPHSIIVHFISEVDVLISSQLFLVEPNKQTSLSIHLGIHVHNILGEKSPPKEQVTDWISNHEQVGIEIHAGDLPLVGIWPEVNAVPIISPGQEKRVLKGII